MEHRYYHIDDSGTIVDDYGMIVDNFCIRVDDFGIIIDDFGIIIDDFGVSNGQWTYCQYYHYGHCSSPKLSKLMVLIN